MWSNLVINIHIVLHAFCEQIVGRTGNLLPILDIGSASLDRSRARHITFGFNLMCWNIKGKNGKNFYFSLPSQAHPLNL